LNGSLFLLILLITVLSQPKTGQKTGFQIGEGVYQAQIWRYFPI